MKFIFILLLISSTYAQDGSNASNTTGDGLSNTTNTTNTTTTESPLHSVTTTLGPTSTPAATTTTSAPIETTTQTSTTTSFLRTTTVLIETTTVSETTTTTAETTVPPTTTIPPCSEATNNTACKVCLGPLCKFVERGEQGVGWEILFVAFGLTIVGLAGLCLYYICLRPLIMGNPAEDIYWDDSDEEDEWSEAQPLNNTQIRRHSRERVRAFEIVDLNPVTDK